MPSRNDIGHPCRLPEGVVRAVLMSACASTHTTPTSWYTLWMAAMEPTARLWSPPSVSTNRPFSAASSATSLSDFEAPPVSRGRITWPALSWDGSSRPCLAQNRSSHDSVSMSSHSLVLGMSGYLILYDGVGMPRMASISPASSSACGPFSTPFFGCPKENGASTVVSALAEYCGSASTSSGSAPFVSLEHEEDIHALGLHLGDEAATILNISSQYNREERKKQTILGPLPLFFEGRARVKSRPRRKSKRQQRSETKAPLRRRKGT